MNKQKYFKKIHTRQLFKKTLFKSVFLVIDNINLNLEIFKINNMSDYANYVQPLINFPNNQGFLLKNVFYFHLNNLVLNMDIVVLDNYFNIIKCFSNTKKDIIIDVSNLKPYNILFLEENSIHFFNIQSGQKVKLSKFNS